MIDDGLAVPARMHDVAARWQHLGVLRDAAVRIVRSRISRPEDAEDHVHEAMVRLAQRDDLEPDPVRLRALLVRAACCIAIDGHRADERRKRLLMRIGDGRVGGSAEDIVADRSEALYLAQGVGTLGQLEREALLHAMDGRRPGEIADLLGVGYKSAENALSRARRKLRLRAGAVVTGLAALLRRLLAHEHAVVTTALATSALAALVILTPRTTPSSSEAQGSVDIAKPPAAHVVLIDQQLPLVGAAALPVPAAGPTITTKLHNAHGTAPAPPSQPPQTGPSQPLFNPPLVPPPPTPCPGHYLNVGGKVLTVPGNSWAGCALSATQPRSLPIVSNAL